MTPDWPRTEEDLVRLQEDLSRLEPEPWSPASVISIAGCFVTFAPSPDGEIAWAGVALTSNHHLIDVQVHGPRAVEAAYQPGLLALREGPLLEEALRSLPHAIDVLLVNATGRDHPRRAGLAFHLGAKLDVPSVGVTDRTLVASGEPPAAARGSTAPLIVGGVEVGRWLRTRALTRPVAVHAGWRTDVDTAIGVALKATRRARTPEPIRRARRAARLARAGRWPSPP